MNIPNAEHYNPDPTYLRSLISQAGISQREAARRLGVSDRLMRMYLADPSVASAQSAPYSIQFALEALAQGVTPCPPT